jgi:aspartyl-tRNA(Asn)/glutamyl-tRNA(Gln) amidotransferase subunit A
MTGTERTIAELLAAQAMGETAESITAGYLANIAARDGQVGAFLDVDADSALLRARAVDAKRKAGKPLGPLAGIPVAIKDNLCTRGRRTTCASRILADFRPPYDAHVVEALTAADAVLIGKTNMDEFAMGSSTENSAFKKTRNPWNLQHIPGGSSGGSAAAVAACEAPASLGSDTGGSIRQPAACCGVVGLKPTYGRVSRYGLVAFASSLDQIGPFGHDAADVARVLGVIAGHDPRDSTSVDRPVPDYLASLETPVRDLRIGLPTEYFGEGLDPQVEAAVRAAVDVFRAAGADVVDVSLPNSGHAIAVYYLIATAEASSNLARYDGVHYGHRAGSFDGLIDMYAASRAEGFGPEVRRRIMLGTYALSSGYKDAYYLKALKVRRLIKNDFDRAFERCDVILGPTAPSAAFRIGEKVDDPLAMYLSDIYTIACNLAGLPGISIPCGMTRDSLPIGLQLQAPAFEEEKLLRVARMFERETDWHARRPAL